MREQRSSCQVRRGIFGEEIEPIFLLEDGTPVWPVRGSDGEDDDSDEDEDGASGDDDDDDEDDDEAKPKAKGKKDNPKAAEFAEEAARRRVENKRLKTELEAANARLKAVDDADKSELDKATQRVAELEGSETKSAETIRNLRIHNAFLSSTEHRWKNPAAALRLADLSGVEIDDDGKVTGLDTALKALAKSDAYLLAEKADDEDEDDEDDKVRSGAPANGSKRRKQKGQPDIEKLAKTYPALRSRVR